MVNGRTLGFTLLELMIVVAVVAILMAIAIPSYQGARVKSNRVDMQSAMTDIARKMASYKMANGAYDTRAGGPLANPLIYGGTRYPSSGTALYNLTMTSDAQTWTLTATPISTTIQKNDGILVLNHLGQRCRDTVNVNTACTPSAASTWPR